ncbi:MAG TPA: plastocyanin/azurin family copper-binding protein [Vicinamibacterales bacterium]|jgi:plastocyanin
MTISRRVIRAMTMGTMLFGAACGQDAAPAAPTPPTPPESGTANAYILPGAVNLGSTAFGDEPVVIHRGERMRWTNADGVEHNVVTDTPSLPEFMTTGVLAPGGEQSFVMKTAGSTRIHCTIHPQMTGTLIVQQ